MPLTPVISLAFQAQLDHGAADKPRITVAHNIFNSFWQYTPRR
jgi:hypothetical protein